MSRTTLAWFFAAAAATIVGTLAARAAPGDDEPPVRTHVVRVRTRDGKPVKDAAVRAATSPPRWVSKGRPRRNVTPWSHDAATDAEGTASVQIGDGPFSICVRHAGFVPCVVGDPADGTEASAVLVPGARIDGRITDVKDGRPLAGVRVRCVPSEIERWEFMGIDVFGECITAADGTFRFDTVAPNEFVVVRADAPGYGRGHADVHTSAADTAVTADLRLDAAAVVTGVVCDADGRARSGARVWAVARTADFVRSEIGRRPWPCWSISDADAEATTGPDGTFRLVGLGANVACVVYVIHHQRPGGQPRERVLSAFTTVTSPAKQPSLALALTPYPRAFVRVLDHDGSPLKDREVATWIDGHGQYNSRTDGDGWAEVAPELDGLRRGKVRVRIDVVARTPAEIDVDLSDGADVRVDVRMGRGAR